MQTNLKTVEPHTFVTEDGEIRHAVKIWKSYKFRLKPNKKQVSQFDQFAGGCRFLWNKVLEMNLYRLEQKHRILRFFETCFWTTLWRHSEEYGFLKDCPIHALQQKLKDLDRAFKDAFDKKQPLKRLPKFKKKGIHDSFRFPDYFKIDDRRIYLPKIGWIGFFKSQEIVGKPKNVTISLDGKHWYCSIMVEIEQDVPVHPSQSVIGINLGIKKFAALSSGEIIKPLNAFKKLKKKLAHEQRKLAKKKKGSSNYKKQQQRVQKVHTKIKNSRLDYLHKLSSTLSKSHAIIVVEAMDIKGMSRSARGTVENPGKNVKVKANFNRAILDQGWGMFKEQLKYKLARCGGAYLEVPANHNSRRCHKCAHVHKDNRNKEKFKCLVCGHEDDADLNAAKNVLAAGHAVLACGVVTDVSSEDTNSASMNQESPRL